MKKSPVSKKNPNTAKMPSWTENMTNSAHVWSKQKNSKKNDQALKCSDFPEENGQGDSQSPQTLSAKSQERALAYCIWKSLTASHGDGKDSSNAGWNLNKRSSQKMMAPDIINPWENPGGWKAITKKRYLNLEVTKFCQDHLSTQEKWAMTCPIPSLQTWTG